MQLKPLNIFTVTIMLFFTFLILFFSGFLEFPSISTAIRQQRPIGTNSRLPITESASEPFTDLLTAFKKWDSQVGCARFVEKHKGLIQTGSNASLQEDDGNCGELKIEHVSILVKGWTWIPDNMDNLYSCRCGLSCLWTKSPVLADKPDALLFETTTPPLQVIFPHT